MKKREQELTTFQNAYFLMKDALSKNYFQKNNGDKKLIRWSDFWNHSNEDNLPTTLPISSNLQFLNSSLLLYNSCYAKRDAPPYSKSLMDGILVQRDSLTSVQLESVSKQVLQFQSIGIIRAGDKQNLKFIQLENNKCLEIMTGAPIPSHLENEVVVIPYESTIKEINNDKVLFTIEKSVLRMIPPSGFIAKKGNDYLRGERILVEGERVLSPQVGILASEENDGVTVFSRPKIIIITTGDEIISPLVTINDEDSENLIRASNSYSLSTELYLSGFHNIEWLHLKDEKEYCVQKCRELFEKTRDENCVYLFVGGVSKGKYDFIPEVLIDLGIQTLFHHVMQRPGKPLFCGLTPLNNKLVLGLPGNPISALFLLRRYFICCWKESEENFFSKVKGILKELKITINRKLLSNFKISPGWTYFFPVEISCNESDGRLVGKIISFNNSGDYLSLSRCSGFIQLNQPLNNENEDNSEILCPFFPWGGSLDNLWF